MLLSLSLSLMELSRNKDQRTQRIGAMQFRAEQRGGKGGELHKAAHA